MKRAVGKHFTELPLPVIGRIPRYKNNYDYRFGVECATDTPRAYQPRAGGPPLLFATDIRMTILVTLALAGRPLRHKSLWHHLGKSAKTSLYGLVDRGIVTMWDIGPSKKFVALDPCHPAAEPLRRLLLKVAEVYPGFTPPPFQPEDRDGGEAPVRTRRLRDVRQTFGDPQRTLPLLLLYILGEAIGTDVGRIAGRHVEGKTARSVLYMYRAFGLLEATYKVQSKRRSFAFRFVETHPLVPAIKDVLRALDAAMPVWRIVAEQQRGRPVPRRGDHRDRRRRAERW
jgi:hypothetical protein